MPLHSNAAGEIDGWGERHTLLIHSAFMAGLATLWLVLPKISPQRFAAESFEATWWFSGMAMVALMAYLQYVHLWAAPTRDFPMDRAVIGGIGLFFALVGKVMGKVRRNFCPGMEVTIRRAPDSGGRCRSG